MKKYLVLVLAIVMVLTMLGGCASTGGVEKTTGGVEKTADEGKTTEVQKQPVKLRVGVMAEQNSLSIVYAKQQGIDKEFGLDFELVTFASGAPMNESLGADEIDLGVMSAASVTAVGSYNCKVIGDICDQAGKIGFVVRGDSDIAKAEGNSKDYPTILGSAETLKGKDILTQYGTGAHVLVLKWLKQFGLTENDVKLINMTFPQAYQAFLAGTGDAVCVLTRTTYDAINNQGFKLAADMTTMGIPLYGTIVVNPKTYDKPEIRDALVGFLKAVFKANEILIKDRDLQIKTMDDWFKQNGIELTPEQVAYEIDTQTLFSREMAKNIEVGFSTRFNAEFMESIGQLESSKLPLMTSNVDKSIWEEAINAEW